MRSWKRWIGGCLVAVAVGTGYLGAAPVFHPASEDGAPIRCDRLPIDVDRMHEIAADLTALAANAARGETPEKLRAAAQLLALAKLLDPGQSKIGALERALAKGAFQSAPDPKKQGRARRRAWECRNWLDKEKSGPDARIFADCLGDALIVVSPEHKLAAGLRKSGEKGRWNGWVADLDAFCGTPDPPPDLAGGNDNEPTPDEHPGEEPGPEKPAVKIQLAQASVRVPIEYRTIPPKVVPGAATPPAPPEIKFGALPVEIKAWSQTVPQKKEDGAADPPPPGPEYLLVGFVDEKDKAATASVHAAMTGIRAVLADRHGGLPPGGRAQFKFGPAKSYDWKRNRNAVAGAVALLMDASLNGRAPEPGAIVFTAVDPVGRLGLPWRPWDRLRRVADDPYIPSGRFVLPREALPLLDGLLVIDNPDFFLRFEVLLAGDMEELAACAAGSPEGGLASAMEKFAAIREAAKGKQTGPFLANRFVRQRLEEVLEEFPDHASARMLLVQSGGNRPMQYSTGILAREIRMVLKPMEWIPKLKPDSKMTGVDDDKLDAAWKACRERLDPLKSRVTRGDQKFFDRAFDLVQSIRTLSNALQRYRKAVRQKPEVYSSAVRKSASLYKVLVKEHKELMNEIGILTGEVDPDAEKPPEKPADPGAAVKPGAP